MTVAWFDLERSQLSWAGVGNVDARLVRSGPELREEVALVFGGVLGYRMPRVRPATMPLERGDLLVMITDGIDAAISPALAGGGAAQALAESDSGHARQRNRRRTGGRDPLPVSVDETGYRASMRQFWHIDGPCSSSDESAA